MSDETKSLPLPPPHGEPYPTPMPGPYGQPYPMEPPPPKKKMATGVKILLGVGAAVVALGIIGALGSNTSPTAPVVVSPTSTSASPEAYTPPSQTSSREETPSPKGLSTSTFGKPGHFTQDGNSYSVTVNKPTNAKCRYSYASLCDKPQAGDRFLTFKVVVKNESSAAITISSGQFELEFGDGTRMEPGGGNAREYSPDTGMEYGSHQIRPGGTYSSTLTFEAPKTNDFTVVMMDNTLGGEDLYGWTF